MKQALRNIRYAVEAVFLLFGMAFFRVLPLDVASALGGVLAQLIGPLTRAHLTASKNLDASMPELSMNERRRILNDMWDNMGRVIGEYPHLSRDIMRRRITIEGLEYLQEAAASGKSVMFVSGHFANWEMVPLSTFLYGLPMVLVYRHANNPVADWVIRRIRAKYSVAMYNKGSEGATNVIRAIKEDKAIGMLIDQKMSDGKPIQFFGREAMTGTAPVRLAIKFQIPILVMRAIRTDGAYFHVSIEPPIMYDKNDNAEEGMQKLYQMFEGWIRDYPAQWFWVHNRWGNK